MSSLAIIGSLLALTACTTPTGDVLDTRPAARRAVPAVRAWNPVPYPLIGRSPLPETNWISSDEDPSKGGGLLAVFTDLVYTTLMSTDPAEQFQTMVSAIGDLTPEERLIGAYLSIRDIPYGSANSPSPFAVIERNRGTAKGKHLLLKMVLTSLGYEVKELWARHDFCKMPIHPWPDVLAPFCNAPLIGFHDFLKVRVGDRWVTVDATYDKQLKRLGFPVPEWDGITDMELPVKAEEVFPVEQPIDEHKRRLVADLPEEMRDRRKHFLQTLKKWLEEERTEMAA